MYKARLLIPASIVRVCGWRGYIREWTNALETQHLRSSSSSWWEWSPHFSFPHFMAPDRERSSARYRSQEVQNHSRIAFWHFSNTNAFEEQLETPTLLADDQYIEELLLQVVSDKGISEAVGEEVVRLWDETQIGKGDLVVNFEFSRSSSWLRKLEGN
jgi:hypothetical protein